METLITSISGALGSVGALAVFFVIQRKDTRQLAEDTRQLAEDTRQLAEDTRQLIQREADRLSGDIQRLDNRLSGDIQREADRLEKNTREEADRLETMFLRETDRLSADIKLADNRLREMEGDMRVVKHQLQITDDTHPSQPEQPRPVAQANPPRRRSPAPTGT